MIEAGDTDDTENWPDGSTCRSAAAPRALGEPSPGRRRPGRRQRRPSPAAAPTPASIWSPSWQSSGTPSQFLRTDLSDVAQARASVAGAIERFGRLDRAVNAAGLTSRGGCSTPPRSSSTRTSPSTSRRRSSSWPTRSATCGSARSPGSIVNIISIAERGGQPFLAPYVAAKSGLAGATRNAAHAHRWDRIRINGVNIGWTATEGESMIQRTARRGHDWLDKADASVPMGKIGRPDEIAEFVVFLLADRSGVVTGSVIDWDQQVIGGQD